MSTNYYALLGHCSHCERSDKVHIGKSGVTVHGYERNDLDTQPNLRIHSWADWKYLLDQVKCPIVDEYGHWLTLAQLIEKFEGSSLEARRRQYDWETEHAHQLIGAPHHPAVLDADGFTVSYGSWC